ncbi:MAG TPA: DoxX family protein [Burkholderiales bacterium]|nr:DoxX family protein [Burkholderiales bacterium]
MNPAAQSQMLLLGRILLALIFLIAGIRKLMAVAGSAGYFAKLGFPMPEVMVWVAIVIEIGGAVLLITGWNARRAAWLLILFTAIATAMAHRFWEFDAAQYANQMNHFLKNVAIIGGLLYLAAFGPGALSADSRARS